MDVKPLAHVLRDLFGGTPNVHKYHDHKHEEFVYVFSSVDRPDAGLTTWATVGMSRFDNKLTAADGRAIRIELVAACQSEFAAMGSVLSSCAFNVASGVYSVTPNVVHPDAVRANDDSVRMKHALLVTPYLWGDEPATIDEPDMVTEFLQVVPIDDDEYVYGRVNGADALVDLLEKAQIDVFDINRPSAAP